MESSGFDFLNNCSVSNSKDEISFDQIALTRTIKKKKKSSRLVGFARDDFEDSKAFENSSPKNDALSVCSIDSQMQPIMDDRENSMSKENSSEFQISHINCSYFESDKSHLQISNLLNSCDEYHSHELKHNDNPIGTQIVLHKMNIDKNVTESQEFQPILNDNVLNSGGDTDSYDCKNNEKSNEMQVLFHNVNISNDDSKTVTDHDIMDSNEEHVQNRDKYDENNSTNGNLCKSESIINITDIKLSGDVSTKEVDIITYDTNSLDDDCNKKEAFDDKLEKYLLEFTDALSHSSSEHRINLNLMIKLQKDISIAEQTITFLQSRKEIYDANQLQHAQNEEFDKAEEINDILDEIQREVNVELSNLIQLRHDEGVVSSKIANFNIKQSTELKSMVCKLNRHHDTNIIDRNKISNKQAVVELNGNDVCESKVQLMYRLRCDLSELKNDIFQLEKQLLEKKNLYEIMEQYIKDVDTSRIQKIIKNESSTPNIENNEDKHIILIEVINKLREYHDDEMRSRDDNRSLEIDELITFHGNLLNDNSKTLTSTKDNISHFGKIIDDIDVKIRKLEHDKKFFAETKRFKEASLILNELKLIMAEKELKNDERNKLINELMLVEKEVNINRTNFEKYKILKIESNQGKACRHYEYLKEKLKRNSDVKKIVIAHKGHFFKFADAMINLLQSDLLNLLFEAKKSGYFQQYI